MNRFAFLASSIFRKVGDGEPAGTFMSKHDDRGTSYATVAACGDGCLTFEPGSVSLKTSTLVHLHQDGHHASVKSRQTLALLCGHDIRICGDDILGGHVGIQRKSCSTVVLMFSGPFSGQTKETVC